MPTIKVRTTAVRVTSEYGKRPRGDFHQGLDFGFGNGTPVSSWTAGKVVNAGWHKVYGYYVKVEAASGLAFSYHALSKISVKVGDKVVLGQTVGLAGKSAPSSTGYHLHVTMWENGVHVSIRSRLKLATTQNYVWNGGAATIPAGSTGKNTTSRSTADWQRLLKVLGYYTATVDGSYGPVMTAAVKRFQQVKKIVADGSIGPAQTAPMLTTVVVDGADGKHTWSVYQFIRGQFVDGVRGKATNKDLQTFLKSKGFYKSVVDGIFGKVSVKALQNFLKSKGLYGFAVDGIEGKQSGIGFQKAINSDLFGKGF